MDVICALVDRLSWQVFGRFVAKGRRSVTNSGYIHNHTNCFSYAYTYSDSIPTTPTLEPIGYLKPPDDYTRVDVNGWTINQRTLAMLAYAQELYGGGLEITGHAITQGSYHDNGSASFGTHLCLWMIDIGYHDLR